MSKQNPFMLGFDMARLAWDSQQVIALRLAKLARGGAAANSEAVTMVAEKIATAQQAGLMMMSGKSPEKIVGLYRRKVAANKRRLT